HDSGGNRFTQLEVAIAAIQQRSCQQSDRQRPGSRPYPKRSPRRRGSLMGSLIKVRELPGGVHPPEHKTQSLQLPLGTVALPPVLILPLNQHIGAPAKPVVNVGDRVLTGQLIAEARSEEHTSELQSRENLV